MCLPFSCRTRVLSSPLSPQCTAFAAKVGKKIPDVLKEAKEKLCGCAGCCDPPDAKADETCYFPITRKITDATNKK